MSCSRENGTGAAGSAVGGVPENERLMIQTERPGFSVRREASDVLFAHLRNQGTINPTMVGQSGTGRGRAQPPKLSRGRSIGYARVSKYDQDLNLQIDALEKGGCRRDRIFVDKVSGTRSQRPGLEACLKGLKAGDVLLVWRLDRLGRSMTHLVHLIEQLRDRGVGFRSLGDGAIDTTTASGELVFHIFSALAQFERRLIQERTKAGLAAARARGRKGGRRPIGSHDPRVRTAQTMHQDKTMAVGDICKTLGISRSTFYRYLALRD
jgi:DNA invertase Pin-like site-specific DNA recombinase